MNQNQREFSLTAIGLLTAWHETDSVAFGFEQLQKLKEDGGDHAVEQALVGMANVAGSLLKTVAGASRPRKTEQEVLREVAELFVAN